MVNKMSKEQTKVKICRLSHSHIYTHAHTHTHALRRTHRHIGTTHMHTQICIYLLIKKPLWGNNYWMPKTNSEKTKWNNKKKNLWFWWWNKLLYIKMCRFSPAKTETSKSKKKKTKTHNVSHNHKRIVVILCCHKNDGYMSLTKFNHAFVVRIWFFSSYKRRNQ